MTSSVSQPRQKPTSAISGAVSAAGAGVDSGPPTSATLINRLQHWEDTAAWRLFVDRYQSLLDSWSRKKLGNSADVDEVNQQVVWEVARRLGAFQYDSSRSFRGWLRTLHNSRLLDFLKIQRRRRLRDVEVARVRRPADFILSENPTGTSSQKLDRAVQRANSVQIEDILTSVQSRVTPKTWSIFTDIAANGQTVAETALRHGMKYTATFAAYSRTCQMLRKEAEARGLTIARIQEMTSEPSPGCPDDATLMQLGQNEHHSIPEDPSAEDSAAETLWGHIESCISCQMRLEQLASNERMALADLIGHRNAFDRVVNVSPDSSETTMPVLNGFRIIRQLGQGARSRVFLAEELSTSRQIALKMIPIESGDSAAQRDLWRSEVRAAASIEHQNVVRLYRVEEMHDCFLLVFEFVSGGTLRDWMSKPVSQMQIARFAETVAATVHQIHQRGILHLDLKPSNILIDAPADASWEQINPRVADFGISSLRQQRVSPRLSEVIVRGTPAYMAPEQLLGDDTLLSPATDVYGLGGILYCLLTGQAPIPDADSGTSIADLLQAPIPAPSELDPTIDSELSQITMRCLQQNPLERYGSANLLAEDLRGWLRRHDRSQADSSTIGGRRRLFGGLTFVAASCLLIVAVWRGIRGGSEDTTSQFSKDRPTVSSSSSAGSVREAVATLLAEQTGSALTVDEQSLIRRLAELPPAFNIERAAQLAVDNQRFTDQILSRGNTTAETCLQFGTLQQASGIRFQEGGLSELYSTARYLLNDSVRLFEFARQQRPDDQQILEKLIASKLALAIIRVDKGPNTSKVVSEHVRDCLAALRPSVPLVTQLTDRRQRVYWSGYILDSFRLETWNHRFAGHLTTAELFQSWEQEAWNAFAQDHDTSDLAFRHMLFMPLMDQLQRVDDLDKWVLRDNRPLLHREFLFLRLAEVFFSPPNPADASKNHADWARTLRDLDEELQTLEVKELTVPMIIHEDLIRPLTTVCTQCRSEFQLDRAEFLQQRYLNLCQSAMTLYPDDSDIHLAFSEAYLQAWKNDLRRERPDIAVENLERSLASAQAAVEASPRSPRARHQVADRIKRLTRFQASRKAVSQNP